MSLYEDGEPKPDEQMDAGAWGCCLVIVVGFVAFWVAAIWGVVHWLRS